MLSTESRRGRRILARLDRGTDLFDGVRTLCQRHDIRCGEVRGIGSLEVAELTCFDQGSLRWKPGRLLSGGGLEMLQLQGNISEERGAISLQAQVTLMRDRDAGVEVLGGHLLRAVVHSVELVIETFDDVLLRREADAATGLSRWHEALAEADTPPPAPVAAPVSPAISPPSTSASPAARPTPAPRPTPLPAAAPSSRAALAGSAAPAPTERVAAASSSNPAPARSPAPTPVERPAPTATPTPTWAEVAAASAASSQPARPARRLSDPEHQEEEILLNAGDVILHPRFQRCVVHRVEGSGEFVQVMLRNGRVVRLSLEVLRLIPQGVENGQRIFTATVL